LDQKLENTKINLISNNYFSVELAFEILAGESKI
jgi:hypothetical protein